MVDLAKSLQTACGIHGIAHSGKRSPSPIAHITDDRRTEMDANPHCEGRTEIGRQRLVQPHQLCRHLTRRGQGLSACMRTISLETKQRHDAISGEFVNTPSGRLDRLAHSPAIAVQQKDDVVGKLGLGDAREIANVRKENRDLPFTAMRIHRAPKSLVGSYGGREQWCYLDGPMWT